MKKYIIFGVVLNLIILALVTIIFVSKKNKAVLSVGIYPESDDYANPLFKKYFKDKWRCEAAKLRKEMQ